MPLPAAVVVRFSALPAHTGELLPIADTDGPALIVAVVVLVPVEVHRFASVTDTV